MAHTSPPIDHHWPVNGTVHKLPGLSVDLHGELSSWGNDEHLGALLFSVAGPWHPLTQHLRDDREEERSLKQ